MTSKSSNSDIEMKCLIKVILFIFENKLSNALYPRLVKLCKDLECPSFRDFDKYTNSYGFEEILTSINNDILENIKSLTITHFGISIDESTDITKNKHLIIYLHAPEKNPIFLGLLSLDKLDAESITNKILALLD
jgi:hypothetical protein